MRILVVGAGALGSLVGGILSADHDVTMIGREAQVDVLNSRGIRIEGITEGEFHPRAMVDVPEGEDFDLIILCVKAYNTDLTLGPLSHLLRDDTWILSLQNGLDNEERIFTYLRENRLPGRVLGGITCHGVTYKEPGLVKHAGVGDTMIGRYHSDPADADMTSEIADIAQHFRKAGLDVDVTPTIEREIWAKTIINSAINPLTAITRERNGILIDNQEIRDIAVNIIKEGVHVAREYGMEISEEEMMDRTFKVAERTSANISSMLQDIMRGRRTEVDSINGAIFNKAIGKGICAPVNWTMYRLIKGLEDEYLRSSSEKR
ncbi:MAG: ketopantoate reductase family protein [Thermoplasmatota archaeon]